MAVRGMQEETGGWPLIVRNRFGLKTSFVISSSNIAANLFAESQTNSSSTIGEAIDTN